MCAHAVNVSARWSGLAALMALGLSAAAQQSIQFSRPANQNPTATANSSLPASHKSPSDFNAPKSLFGDDSATASFDILPTGPAPIIPNSYALQWQKILQDRKNWALMTPEQILGMPTPESILGITDPRDDPKLSPEERYLQRQDRRMEMAATNGLPRPDGVSLRQQNQDTGLFQNRNDRGLFTDNPSGLSPRPMVSGPARFSSPFLSQNPGASADMNQASDSTWASPFGSPQPPPQSTPEQLQGMERFRALFESPVSAKAPASAGFALPTTATPDPNLQAQPAFNPVGRSATPVLDDIAKPTGLAPLAGVTGPLPAPAKKPPLVQPPPWMSQSPQNSIMPQRQF